MSKKILSWLVVIGVTLGMTLGMSGGTAWALLSTTETSAEWQKIVAEDGTITYISMIPNLYNPFITFQNLFLKTGNFEVAYHYDVPDTRYPTRWTFVGYNPGVVTEEEADVLMKYTPGGAIETDKAIRALSSNVTEDGVLADYEAGRIAEREKEILLTLLAEDRAKNWATFYYDYESQAGLGNASLQTWRLVTDTMEINMSDIMYYALEFRNKSDDSLPSVWIKGKLDYRDCAHAQALEALREEAGYATTFKPQAFCDISIDEESERFVFRLRKLDGVQGEYEENEEGYRVMTWAEERDLRLVPTQTAAASNVTEWMEQWWGNLQEWLATEPDEEWLEEELGITSWAELRPYARAMVQNMALRIDSAEKLVARYGFAEKYAEFFAGLRTRVAGILAEVEVSSLLDEPELEPEPEPTPEDQDDPDDEDSPDDADDSSNPSNPDNSADVGGSNSWNGPSSSSGSGGSSESSGSNGSNGSNSQDTLNVPGVTDNLGIVSNASTGAGASTDTDTDTGTSTSTGVSMDTDTGTGADTGAYADADAISETELTTDLEQIAADVEVEVPELGGEVHGVNLMAILAVAAGIAAATGVMVLLYVRRKEQIDEEA